MKTKIGLYIFNGKISYGIHVLLLLKTINHIEKNGGILLI